MFQKLHSNIVALNEDSINHMQTVSDDDIDGKNGVVISQLPSIINTDCNLDPLGPLPPLDPIFNSKYSLNITLEHLP